MEFKFCSHLKLTVHVCFIDTVGNVIIINYYYFAF